MDKTKITRGNADLLDLSPLKAIRAKCLDCCCDSRLEVKLCTKDGVHGILCPLYQYRLGHNPNRTGRVYTEEEKKAIAERLANYRKNGSTPNIEEEFFEEFDEDDDSISSDESNEKSIVYDEEDL